MASLRVMSCRPSLLVLRSLYCLWMLSIHVPRADSLSFNLSFSRPQRSDLPQLIALSGDASFSPDTLEVTRNTLVESIASSVGRATYKQQVPLWDGATGEMASFTTTFYFRIARDNASHTGTGDGMAFFLGDPQSGIPANSSGSGLGLVPISTKGGGGGGGGGSSIVAVEFDTFLNTENDDISNSHVGIDVNSVNSTASTDATSPTANLTSGDNMMATVRYENVTKLLAVELLMNGTWYYVNATIDLRNYLPENVAVGFSGSTGLHTELHQVLSWSFTSTLEPKKQKAPAPAPLIVSSNPPKKRAGILVPVLVPLLFLLACAAVLGLLLWQKRKRSRDNDYEQQDDSAELARGVAATGPRRYTYRELAAATNNFADGEKLGRGGFGSVYRGNLAVVSAAEEDRRPVAIKMFSLESSAQGRKEFEAEVRIISRLKHRNLVQLLGWSDSRNGLLLVYELVAEGSLDKHLHSCSSKRLLSWPERYQIILGLGSALRYLHHEWEQCVVHGDIKPSNIMLDESYGAKLGDFGLARLGDHGGRWHTTKAVLGTAGYIDPEFVNTRHPSTHSDVYSFGIVLLEIVSGRSPVILHEGGGPPFVLLKWVWGLYGQNRTLDAADERLRGDEINDRCMKRVLIVGLWCAHPDQSERPSMAQAMQVLQSEDARLPALPLQMYKTSLSGFAVTGRALSSIGSYSGESSTTATTGDSKLSSGSSTTALLRDSKERA